ncbi:MAG: arginase family protein, partial [Chloroflexi bacterium]|nr:arginase family protein [Chloroflexota bacterium]
IGVVDSGYASGTGDIVIGGLTPVELLGLMREFSGSSKIGALDVVEVAPALDIRGRSERLAAEAVIELIAPRVFGA